MSQNIPKYKFFEDFQKQLPFLLQIMYQPEFVAAMTQFSSQFNERNHESQQHESIFLLIFICTMHNTSRQMLFLLESYYLKHTSSLRFFSSIFDLCHLTKNQNNRILFLQQFMYFHKCKNSYFRCSFVQVLVCTLDVEFNASLSYNSTQSDIFSQIETNDPKI